MLAWYSWSMSAKYLCVSAARAVMRLLGSYRSMWLSKSRPTGSSVGTICVGQGNQSLSY